MVGNGSWSKLERMKPRHFVASIVIYLTMANSVEAETFSGKVVGVKDGDTVVVLVDRREVVVRVSGIDAPEKKQPFGERSKQAMSDCAFSKQSSVDWNKTDRYGRTIGKITVDGFDCGLHLIEMGLAWHYKTYATEQPENDRAAYALAEVDARSARAGLWADADPKPPWTFRHPSAHK